jgi:hypothetical protein
MSGLPLEIMTYKEGKRHGKYELYKQEGLDTYGQYVNGEKEGEWVEHKFNEGGEDRGSYIKGKKNGKWELGATNLLANVKVSL